MNTKPLLTGCYQTEHVPIERVKAAPIIDQVRRSGALRIHAFEFFDGAALTHQQCSDCSHEADHQKAAGRERDEVDRWAVVKVKAHGDLRRLPAHWSPRLGTFGRGRDDGTTRRREAAPE
jgi:hypothetical protein